jgi:hypothetical protein
MGDTFKGVEGSTFPLISLKSLADEHCGILIMSNAIWIRDIYAFVACICYGSNRQHVPCHCLIPCDWFSVEGAQTLHRNIGRRSESKLTTRLAASDLVHDHQLLSRLPPTWFNFLSWSSSQFLTSAESIATDLSAKFNFWITVNRFNRRLHHTHASRASEHWRPLFPAFVRAQPW